MKAEKTLWVLVVLTLLIVPEHPARLQGGQVLRPERETVGQRCPPRQHERNADWVNPRAVNTKGVKGR